MMRLHEMQVRMTPVLRWAITGSTSSTKTHVIATTIGVSTMVIPNGDNFFFYFEEDRCSNKIKWITIYILTILFSCVSAGDSCHVLVAWIFPYVLSHNPGTLLDYAAPDPCPTLCKNNERNNKVKQGKYQTPLSWIAQDEGLFFFFCISVPYLSFHSSLRLSSRSRERS